MCSSATPGALKVVTKQPWSTGVGMGLDRGRGRNMHEPFRPRNFPHSEGISEVATGESSVIKIVKGTMCTQTQSSSERRVREGGSLKQTALGLGKRTLRASPMNRSFFPFPLWPNFATSTPWSTAPTGALSPWSSWLPSLSGMRSPSPA